MFFLGETCTVLTVLFLLPLPYFDVPQLNFKLEKYAVKRSSSITAFHIFFHDHIT